MKKLTKTEIEICDKIITRAMDMGFYKDNRTTAFMDVMNAAKYWNMRLEDWLNADDFNFAHDFIGIKDNINRENGFPATDFGLFIPRFAGSKEE